MPVHNKDVKDVFNKIADMLELKGENAFRIRAYRNAARTIGSLSESVQKKIDKGDDLSQLSGIGKDLAGKIEHLVKTGSCPMLEDLEKEMPPALTQMMKIEGLGARRVKEIYEELDIKTVEDLKKAAEHNKIRDLEGFGKKTEEKILKEIERLQSGEQKRMKISEAEEIADSLVAYLKKSKSIKDIVVAGSFRRRKETIGDLDILVTCKKGGKDTVMDRFVKYDEVEDVISKGKNRSTIRLTSGIHVDLRVLPQVSYGAALHYFTGSKAHNIAVRKRGVERGLKINEYGVFKNEDDRIAGETEQEVYDAVELPYIEPELREDRGEIKAAENGSLPELITLKDIHGDLHVHTNRTDGHHTLKEIAQAAAEHGYEYIAITDHSQRLSMVHGLKPEDVEDQIAQIDEFNKNNDDIVFLKGSEVDILEDGSLDLPDDLLKKLDIVVCSVHSKFNLSSKEQTERIIHAIENPYTTIIAHPTGRRIHERESYEVDMEKIMKAAKKHTCCLELNAHPERLDLTDIYCKMAKDMGVTLAISTDTHRINDLDYMRYGIGQARRGWLEKSDVLNTKTLKQLQKYLKKRNT